MASLLDLALDTFLPTRRITVPDQTRPGHSRSDHIPLFPRYLFADVSADDFALVPTARGVSQVVSTLGWDGQPQYIIVPDKAIAAMQEPTHPTPSFSVGQSVRLRQPYAGLMAIIHSIRHLDTTGHLDVWLDMMGSTRSVALHHSLVLTEGSAPATS